MAKIPDMSKWPSFHVPMNHHKTSGIKPLTPRQEKLLQLVRMYRKAKSKNVKSRILDKIHQIELNPLRD